MNTETPTLPHQPIEPPASPRLGIIHLMLWTFFSAAHLSLSRVISALNHDSHSNLVDLQSTTDVIQCIAAGALFTAAVILVKARVQQGGPLLRQPGHCLVLIGAIFHLLMLLLAWVRFTMARADDMINGVLLLAALFGNGVIELGVAIGYVVALWSGWQLRWKLCFGVLAGLNALLGISYLAGSFIFVRAPFSSGPSDYLIWLSPIVSGGFILVGIWIVVVSIVDVRGGKRLDWLHWLGVVSYVTPSCLGLAWLIAYYINW